MELIPATSMLHKKDEDEEEEEEEEEEEDDFSLNKMLFWCL